MKDRPIASARQLGAAIHDARRAAGLTQAELATQAGVSREWLIGIEQGSRPRAELGKILDILRVLRLSIHLQPTSQETPSKSDNRPSFDPTTLTRQALENMRPSFDPTTLTRQALENMRLSQEGKAEAEEDE